MDPKPDDPRPEDPSIDEPILEAAMADDESAGSDSSGSDSSGSAPAGEASPVDTSTDDASTGAGDDSGAARADAPAAPASPETPATPAAEDKGAAAAAPEVIEPRAAESTDEPGAPTAEGEALGDAPEKKKKKKKDKAKGKTKDQDKKKKKDKKGDKKKDAARKKKRKKKARKRPPRHVEPPLPPELKEEAYQAAVECVVSMAKTGRKGVEGAIAALKARTSIPFLARFRRHETGGMDEQRLRNLRDGLHDILHEEERRSGIRALLKKRGAWSDEVAAALDSADTIPAMEDLAAPFLPVTASRATMARGQHLQGLADAIRTATEAGPLSDLAKPFVPEGVEPTAFDVALGGARDILAEELSLDAGLRARLRALFLKDGVLRVAARNEKRKERAPDANGGPLHDAPEEEAKEAPAKSKPAKGAQRPPRGSLVGFSARAMKVPPMKVLALRRAEKQRQVIATIEPPEEKAIAIVHKHAVPGENPHAGFLRAAAEDGYRRILKPMLQNELRLVLKRRADDHAMEQVERSLRNLLLGPYAGPRRTLGLRPDVMNGHRWCAVDEAGQAAGSGQLPHEPTAGREACLTELTDVLKTYEISAIAVGTSGGRADALALARQAAKDIEKPIDVTEVPDGGTRALESMGPLEFENHLTVPAECRGALSLARRFQDPLAEFIQVEPKALALGPHLHELHQGRLRTLLDDVVESCVAYVGVDPNRASVELLSRVPGFDRKTARAFLTYRNGAGPLQAKAELAAIDDVGPKVAEQAVGFLRILDAPDPRDRTQLHPEQYAAAEKMAEQVGVDMETLFSDPEARKRVKLDALADDVTSLGTLKYVLYEATAGQADPRPRFTQFIPPPAGMKLEDLAAQPNLMLQGRVIRAAPFGVFLDVGLGIEALIPIPHIGDRPGLEPSTVAPVGAVISARVLEVDRDKKRLTLSMRRHAPARGAGGRGRGDRGPRRGRDGDRPSGDRRPVGAGASGGPRGDGQRTAGGPRTGGGGPRTGDGPRAGGGARTGDGPRTGGVQRSGGGPRTGGGQRTGGGARFGGQGGRQGGAGGRQGGRQRKPGRYEGGGGGFGGRGGGRQDRNTPRSISLKPDEPEKKKVDESKLTPEELLALKLEEMKRKLERPDAS